MTLSSHNTLQVIGAGWGRTGTMSLKKALEILGYNPTYHFFEFLQHPSHVDHWLDVIDGKGVDFEKIYGSNPIYTATCDFPSCVFWKEQLASYPHAKVILTVRDPESWYQSARETIFRGIYSSPYQLFGIRVVDLLGLNPIKREFWRKLFDRNIFAGDWSKKNIISAYQLHIAKVVKECPNDKLLLFDVKEGWKPLCTFLKKPIPKEPFPHLNDFAQLKSLLWKVNMFGYFLLSVIIAVLAIFAYYFPFLQ